MFEQKIKMNRKKNHSSKIIVDEYDHLIKNSKIQPNFDSFLEPPLSPHFNPRDLKYTMSKQQSSQSEYSMQNINDTNKQKECFKCGQIFQLRIYESHLNICEHNTTSNKKQSLKNFNKKNQYNFFPANTSHCQESKVTSARNNYRNQNTHEPKQTKKIQLKKSNSKISIQSNDKNTIKRPSSSTRNKLDIKGHQNLKQKILSKLEGNRNKNHLLKEQTYKKVSSQNKYTLSNSKSKSVNRNISNNKKYNTINSSSINKKNISQRGINYDFNHSELLSNTSINRNKKQKTQFLSKTNIKEEKKQTLKKKNINSNNSFVLGQPFQRQKQKTKRAEIFNIKENSSYFSQANQQKNKKYQQKQKQILKQELRNQGPFRRQSSNEISRRKFHREYQHEMCEQKPNNRDVNDEYFFFENHPSTVPYHVTKRQDRPYSRYEMDEENMFEDNSSSIIRNKLGLNKQAVKSKQDNNAKQFEIKNKIASENLISQQKYFHQEKQRQQQLINHKNNSSRQNYHQNDNYTNKHQPNNPVNINRNQQRHQERARNIQQNINLQRLNSEIRQRPINPMGISRNIPERRQNLNRAQNRPQPRLENQRIHSQNAQRQNNEPSRNQPQQQNRRQSGNRRQRRRQNANGNRQTNSNNRLQNGQTNNRRIHQDTLNFISNTLNEQFEVMKQDFDQISEHFNLLNNIFSNFSNIVNVNITASTSNQNPTTFVFRSHGRRRNGNRENEENDESSQTHSEYSDFSSDFSEDESLENQTDYSEDEYYYEEEENQNPGMTEHEINSIPILRYSKQKHGSNQCTICLVELNETELFKKLYCDHVFHTECIDQWLKRKNACPVCRDQMGVRY